MALSTTTNGSTETLRHFEATRNTPAQLDYYSELAEFIEESSERPLQKMMSFATYAPRQVLTGFIERYELYKRIRNLPGAIIECGVAAGQGLMTFAQLCAIHEPYHYVRRVVGFDTFEGFQGITDKDRTSKARHMVPGGLAFPTLDKLRRSIELFDQNRALGHIPKVELVPGDISATLPKYLDENPATVVALLYLDLDLYKPTLDTINALKPRLFRGSIIAFDELNHSDYPGETIAVMESLGLDQLELERFDVGSNMCFCRWNPPHHASSAMNCGRKANL